MRNFYQLRDESGDSYVLDTHLSKIRNCARFMREVLNSQQCCLTPPALRAGRRLQQVTSLGSHLLDLHDYADLFTRHVHFHPAIAFFFEEYRKHCIHGYQHFGPHDVPIIGKTMADIFDDFVKTMRAQASKTNLKKKVADWESKFKKNQQRARQVEFKLFERYPLLRVIRLRLDHAAASFSRYEIEQFEKMAVANKTMDLNWYENGGDIARPVPLQGRVAFEEVQKDRRRLFGNMKGKPSLFANLVGFIWRIDCSPYAGYQLSVLFFFEVTEVNQHDWLAEQIGQYWVDHITSGRGRFQIFTPSLDPNSPHFGLGVIGHHDQAKRGVLRHQVLSSFGRRPQLVQVLPQVGCNLFGSGFVHRKWSSRGNKVQALGDNALDQPGFRPA